MKKAKKIARISLDTLILIFIILLVVWVYLFNRMHRNTIIKPDDELIWERYEVPRSGEEPVNVNLYYPDNYEWTLPVVFNIHWWAFFAWSADTLDTQSERIAKDWNVMVVNINYKLLNMDYSISYALDEIVDTIKYFKNNAEKYKIDPNKMIVMWYSAGWDYAMEACITLKKENIDVFAQILWYAYIWDADDMYQEELSQDQQKSIAPALFILADDDIIWDTSLEYEEILRENWIQTEIKQYSWAMHWFIESNNPEREAVTWERPEQKEMARDAEDYALQWLKDLWL